MHEQQTSTTAQWWCDPMQGSMARTGTGKGAHHEGLGPALQLRGNLDLGRGSAGDQEALVDEAADDA